MVIMVVFRSQRDAVKPLMMKVGIAITLTVAGFLFKAWKLRSRQPPTSPGLLMEDLKLIERGKRVAAAGGGAGLEELPHQVADEK